MGSAVILDFRALERYYSGVRFGEYFSFVQYIGTVNLKPQNGCSWGGADPPQLGAPLSGQNLKKTQNRPCGNCYIANGKRKMISFMIEIVIWNIGKLNKINSWSKKQLQIVPNNR